MTHDDPRLVDYLAGELDAENTARVEAALRRDPALRARVEGLRAAEAGLRAGLPDLSLAEQEVAGLPLRVPDAGRAGRLARYAAVILVGFAIGFWARGFGSSPVEVAPVAPREVAVDAGGGFERFASSYVAVSQQRPRLSALGRGLLALAKR